MDKGTLERTLLKNVVQLTYIKKNGEHRAMYCTKSSMILNSFEGETVLGFRKPKHSLGYDISQTDNVIVWDLEKRDYRTIQAERVTLDEVVPEEKFYKALQDDAIDFGAVE